MRIALIFLTLAVAGCASSGMPSDLKRHIKAKSTSLIRGTVEVSMDTIFYKGEPWGIMRLAPGNLGLYPSYHIYTLRDQLVITAVPKAIEDSTQESQMIYLIHFLSEATPDPSIYPVFLRRRDLAHDLVSYRVIENNTLNESGIKNFQRIFKKYTENN
ncbi:MAG: hypothetical protein ACK4EX_11290 [Thermaurantimonas sp.]|uniref:hypothetical protein n=1 Tax=Thermaurantimonas sp. TaxID=2681568 RepID=UPI00391A2920